ncbi:MAG: competence/damage-inducible protein A [Bdellovibrionales bacterium]|nr:competence/damage-inducible protein A [Bdellovibrionales bacterium]
MIPAPKARILCVGTELTTGQIQNLNASTLSQWLTDLGVEVTGHDVVPDDRKLIHQALVHSETDNDILIVTGGLGPTTDDFTRDVIADWLGKPLKFSEGSWKWIQERLGKAGVAVAESNRQQCYFPEGSVELHNPEGTAYGFQAWKNSRLWVWVLPGPPVEIRAIWKGNRIGEVLSKKYPHAKRPSLFRWQCLGKSESALGEIVESALQGSGYTIGYRAHRPYIEVKVWVEQPESDLQWAKRKGALEAAIQPWVICRDDEDIAEKFVQSRLGLKNRNVLIHDSATQGVLAQRLGSLNLKDTDFMNRLQVISRFSGSQSVSTPEGFIEVWKLDSKTEKDGSIHFRLEVFFGQATQPAWVHQEKLPFKGEAYLDRARRFMAEKFLFLASQDHPKA